MHCPLSLHSSRPTALMVIEHNLDVIKTTDHGCGTPEGVAAVPRSFTERFSRQVLGEG